MSALVIDCWRVALFSAKGEGVFEMVAQSSSKICLHLGAVGRSHSGVVLMLRLSFILPLSWVRGGQERAHVCEGHL